MSDIVLCNMSDANSITKELRGEWLDDIFDVLEIPDEVFDAETINDYRYEMEELGIEVILYSTGEINVYKKVWIEGPTEFSSGYLPADKRHLIAQWKNPTRVRRIEGNEMYYELHVNEWSVVNMRKI